MTSQTHGRPQNEERSGWLTPAVTRTNELTGTNDLTQTSIVVLCHNLTPLLIDIQGVIQGDVQLVELSEKENKQYTAVAIVRMLIEPSAKH